MDVQVYRDLLHRSVYNAEVARYYFDKMRTTDARNSAIVRGYKAMSYFIMCKHTYNPFSKIAYFNKGKRELESAINMQSDNKELLFLRLATQCNTPAFLGYSVNIESDKRALLNYLALKSAHEDKDLRDKIIRFILQCKQYTNSEKSFVKENYLIAS